MSDELRGYDAWKTTPPEAEEIECPACGGSTFAGLLTATVKIALDEADGKIDNAHALARILLEANNAPLHEWDVDLTDGCERCGGTGYIDPPTPEDIAERRADEQLSDPDFNRQTGRYYDE